MKIGILDYKACNLASVYHTLYNLGYEPIIIKSKEDFTKIKKLIIPGVGSAKHCLNYLRKKNLLIEINKLKDKGMPIMGICLGMQIFSNKLYEHGTSSGLNYFDADVVELKFNKKFNIGWHQINLKKNYEAKFNFENKPSFFFCHSYYLNLKKSFQNKYVVATIKLENEIPVIIKKNNIFGVQFHPEKSQDNGIKTMQFFLEQL